MWQGGGVTDNLLRRADELQAAGIVTGSLHPSLRTLAGSLNVPILVTEGFGETAMCAPAFELLSAVSGQEAAINAQYQPRGRTAARPELFVPLVLSRMQHSDQAAEMKRPEVSPGARVRGAYGEYLGRVGTLPEDFTLQWVTTEAGAHLPGVEVAWSDATAGRQVVPWTNLELIG